jgi:uncharacterized protein YacL
MLGDLLDERLIPELEYLLELRRVLSDPETDRRQRGRHGLRII